MTYQSLMALYIVVQSQSFTQSRDAPSAAFIASAVIKTVMQIAGK